MKTGTHKFGLFAIFFLMLLTIIGISFRGCSDTKAQLAENERLKQEKEEAIKQYQIAITESRRKEKLLADCSRLNDSIAHVQESNYRNRIKDREKTISNKPLTDKQLKREIADIYNAAH